jgi:hypothetical protein
MGRTSAGFRAWDGKAWATKNPAEVQTTETTSKQRVRESIVTSNGGPVCFGAERYSSDFVLLHPNIVAVLPTVNVNRHYQHRYLAFQTRIEVNELIAWSALNDH